MMIPAFLIAAICASKEGMKRFETFALPISAVLTLAHVVILIVLQVYIFKVEKGIKDDWPELYNALIIFIIGFYVYLVAVLLVNLLSCIYGVFSPSKAPEKQPIRLKDNEPRASTYGE
eukprot:TRINITY_DN4349_c0_g3_i2.p2 TRINITY_DN4349_c0_g3~~TRINITY_DN4349_c0_g3_i2.p2  ORF type:complete len:118 (-),score=31.70 TRINITY_DN4349_c0_g3_i2:146-499(-)